MRVRRCGIRLFELLFDQPPECDAALAEAATARPTLALGEVDPTAVAPYLGRYVHPALGEVTIALRGDKLVLETGEVNSELRLRADDGGGATAYLLHDPPLSLYSEAYGVTVGFAGAPDAIRLIITVPANVTSAEQVYIFEPLTVPGTQPP